MPSAERRRTTQRQDHRTALTPDDIEGQAFTIEPRGYDRDEVRSFLYEVSSALRLALHGTAVSGMPGTPRPGEIQRARAEVAELLRTAAAAADARREEADGLARAIVEQAQQDARDIRRRAEADEAWKRDQAKRILIAAQEQAAALARESSERADQVLETAQNQARRHLDQATRAARRRADEIAAAEKAVLSRLNAARLELGATIDALTASPPGAAAVVDLTAAGLIEAQLAAGASRGAGTKPPEARLPADQLPADQLPADQLPADAPAPDPVGAMVRSAIERAVGAASRPHPIPVVSPATVKVAAPGVTTTDLTTTDLTNELTTDLTTADLSTLTRGAGAGPP